MAQSVNPSDFGSGRDLMVREVEPCMGLSAVSTEPASDPLFPHLSGPLLLVLFLFLKLNIKKLKKI